MSTDPKKHKKSQKDRFRSAVERNVAVLDHEKPEEVQPSQVIEDARVRTTLERDRNMGQIALERIRPDPNQVRRVNTKSDDFEGLVDSVRAHGVLEPITVRWIPDENVYQIITGERRYHAAKRAGLKTIPVIRKDVDDTTASVHQLIENLQRENMNPIDEAMAFRKYLAATKQSQKHLSNEIGKTETYVSRMMTILEKLTREEQDEIRALAPAQLPGKTLILEALRVDDPKIRLAILRGEYTRDEAREIVKEREKKRPVGRPKYFSRRFELEKRDAIVSITYRKLNPTRDEVEHALLEAYEMYERSLRDDENEKPRRKRR